MRNVADLMSRTTTGNECLSQYVRCLLMERNLSPADVELRAGGKISDSRIAGLAVGDSENLRCETLCALARGLGVAEERLFAVAIGTEISELQEYDFLVLYREYTDLSGADQQEIDRLLALLHREIERLSRRKNSSVIPLAQHEKKDIPECQNHSPFSLSERVSLKEYICRLLKENRLTLKDVEQRSEQKISVSYLRNIILDGMNNLTIEKIKALACGLRVSPQEIFAVLEDQAVTERRQFKSSLFAALYYKYKFLAQESKEELHLFIKLVACEIDRRQMQQLRRADKLKALAITSTAQRKAS